MEALSRPDPAYDFANPAQTFDVAVDIDRAQELDELCVTVALEVADKLPPDALLFVNLVPETIAALRNGDDWLGNAVRAAGLAPERVVIEVTERYSGRTSAIVACLLAPRAQGFKIAVDDVGTGNSGLEMLAQVAPDFVKIDRSIVAAAPESRNARGVLFAMATFARQTGAFVIAEGYPRRNEEMSAFVQRSLAKASR